jgi:hypothetical protein
MRADSVKQRLESALHIPMAYRRLALAGWLLYAISWITPSADARQVGAIAFVATVKLARNLLATGTARALPLGLCVLFGWLANVSIFIRLPTWARLVWTAAPWLTFAVVLLILPVRPSLPARAAFFLYFYPWAVGIALIHSANIAATRRNHSDVRFDKGGQL